MKFFIYSRKSVFTGKGDSIENQIEMCRHYIISKFGSAVEDITIYEDEGFSAKNTERPHFQKMLRDMKLKKPHYIVCYRLDRISRNVSDFAGLIEELNRREISFVCIKEEFDTSKPMGKAMMYIASVFAQLERETIAERVRDNMLMLARTGRWLGGTTPTGFISEKGVDVIMDGKVKHSCMLKVDNDEIQIVETLFEKYLELQSVSGVSKYLIKRSITSRTGKLYSLQGIKEILQNPVYCVADHDAFSYFKALNADVCFDEKDCSEKLGLITYNKRDYKKAHAPRQPVQRWIVAIGKHKGLIPGRKWIAVQNALAAGKPDGKTPSKLHNNYALLSGLIYCKICGSRMFAKNRGGSMRFDYLCSNKLRGGMALCHCQNINGQQADESVLSCLTNYSQPNSSLCQNLERLRNEIKGWPYEFCPDLISNRIKKCTDEMNHLLASLSQSNLNEAFIQRVNLRITELDNEQKRLIQEVNRIKEATSKPGSAFASIGSLVRELSPPFSDLSTLTLYEKRILIKLLVERIVWDGQELHLFMCSH